MQNHNLAGETFVELAAVAVVSSARISKKSQGQDQDPFPAAVVWWTKK